MTVCRHCGLEIHRTSYTHRTIGGAMLAGYVWRSAGYDDHCLAPEAHYCHEPEASDA